MDAGRHHGGGSRARLFVNGAAHVTTGELITRPLCLWGHTIIRSRRYEGGADTSPVLRACRATSAAGVTSPTEAGPAPAAGDFPNCLVTN